MFHIKGDYFCTLNSSYHMASITLLMSNRKNFGIIDIVWQHRHIFCSFKSNFDIVCSYLILYHLNKGHNGHNYFHSLNNLIDKPNILFYFDYFFQIHSNIVCIHYWNISNNDLNNVCISTSLSTIRHDSVQHCKRLHQGNSHTIPKYSHKQRWFADTEWVKKVWSPYTVTPCWE